MRKIEKCALFLCVVTMLGGCASNQSGLAPGDTVLADYNCSDECFIGDENHCVAYGFDSQKTEYNYTAADVIESLYFGFDSVKISGRELKKIESVAQILSKNKSLHIIVVGNCDKFGTEKYNYSLGKRRAEAVRDALASLGAGDDRITTASLGSRRANKDVGTKDKAVQDRRCDIVIHRLQ
ncbi:MAG: OmpA family protein [Puniceicoccales bacterium]|jgi:outer membrane protein OmpA-like peptidoglycan-associated protein|nr:OmpA family protein [Puniceicoccales bacterium]